jgi:hypothetical protein
MRFGQGNVRITAHILLSDFNLKYLIDALERSHPHIKDLSDTPPPSPSPSPIHPFKKPAVSLRQFITLPL